MQACLSLHSCGYMLFLESKDSVESSWIIHNQEVILSMVHGFHKLVEMPNPLGLVSLTQLQTGLGSMGFNITLATRYLLRMEFCIKLADRRVLYSISGFDPPHPLEEHLFFPHLVRSSAPPDLWEGSDTYNRHFGWYMTCVDDNQMLGPRFSQLLILRLSSQFCFNTDPNSPFSIKRSSCVIWRRGLSWYDSRGIEGMVQLRKQNKSVMFLSRMKKANHHESPLDFFHFRSSIIRAVREVKRETCARIRVTESVIHPESLTHGPPQLDSAAEVNFPMLKISDIFASLMSPESSCSVVWEQTLQDSETVEIITNTSIKIQDLLEFEPFAGLPHSVLAKVFSEEERSCPILNGDLDNLSECLCENRWELRHLLILLSLPYSNSRAVSDSVNRVAANFRVIFDRWLARTGEGRTYFELLNLLSQYSIFDVIVS